MALFSVATGYEFEVQRRKLIAQLRPHLGGVLADDEEPLLSSREVALLFRVSPATVRRWADQGKIEARRSLGGQWIFRLCEIRRALEKVHAPFT